MIKNFIYLDEQKLYSFSSQLFEGITDFVLNEEFLDKSTEKSSKDGTPITSSQVIANVIRETSMTTEKKFLHDHAFNLLEKQLESDNLLLDLTNSTSSYSNLCNSEKSFVKIKSPGMFLDLRELQEFFLHFDNIAEALTILPLTEVIRELEAKKAEDGLKNPEVKKRQAELDKYIRTNKANISGLPERSTASFHTIMERFGDKLIRFKQSHQDISFSSYLEPSNLRDPITSIYRKYSRKTAKDFVVLGVISHATNTPPPELNKAEGDSNIFSHIENMGEHLYNLESTFSGRKGNEVIIEPIAIYTQL